MSELNTYRKKRDFRSTPEPSGDARPKMSVSDAESRQYLIQKHAASRLHYDFRLELDGVLKSWAVPKGPSLDPEVRALAVHVEDHPLEYGSFEGRIPEKQYGGGTVMLWDQGSWEPIGDPHQGYRRGKLKFKLHGQRLAGAWQLVRMSGKANEDGNHWLLIKKSDAEARGRDEYDVLSDNTRSVVSDRTMEQIRNANDAVWNDTHADSGEKHESDKDAFGNAIAPADLPGSKRRKSAQAYRPQLATAVKSPPAGERWVHELKYDGYRLLAEKIGSQVRLWTRRRKDWTERFPRIADAVSKLDFKNAVIDGELVVVASDGTTDFQSLQNQMRRGEQQDLVYYAFDLLYCDGFDLTSVPLIDRKRLLSKRLRGASSGTIRYSDHITGGGHRVFHHACRHALEGLISKRADSVYEQRRSQSWVKSKCLQRQEFVVGGWSDPSGKRMGFGSLLLGYFENDELVYCGRVGTGFSQRSLQHMSELLEGLTINMPPFASPPRGSEARDVHWVQPELVVEVEFTEWTEDGRLRHPSFQGLREDKPAHEVMRERTHAKKELAESSPSTTVATPPRARSSSLKSNGASATVAGVTLTHPDRVLYPEQGISKAELASYYEFVSDWLLPHLEDRPLTLVRCPQGRNKQCFYQKHLTDSMPPQLKGIEIKEKQGVATYVLANNLPGVIALVQMSVLEMHPWPARSDRIDRPDRLIFDLDPGPGVEWNQMLQASREVRERLERYELESFVRTSGGKGLHVVVPLTRRNTWDEIKAFSRAIARRMAANSPQRYVATASKDRRAGKIFIDYLRNQRGATAVASFSTRARPGAPVATPVRWDELSGELSPDKYTIATLPNRLSSLKQDPWDGFFQRRQSITRSVWKEVVGTGVDR